MNLIVSTVLGENFIEFIKYKMFIWLKAHIDVNQLQSAQMFVETESKYNSIYRSSINLYDFCLYSYLLLEYKKFTSFYKIEFDKDSTVYGLNVKNIDIVNLINYGNLVVKPYPIFTKMFDYFNNNISELQEEYLLGIGE